MVLYEDNHIIIVNKQVGELVQSDKTGDSTLAETVKTYIKKKYNKPGDVFLGIVHRLDRPVSGAIIFARTSKALTRINKMLKDREIEKTYWAVSQKYPQLEEGTLVHYITRNEKKNKSHAHDHECRNSKKAILHYKLLSRTKNFYLLEIKLETGRHHQIRCQLAKVDCIIKGDLKYGARRSNKEGGIHLHSRHVSFIHPVSKEKISVTAPPPSGDNLWKEFVSMSGN